MMASVMAPARRVGLFIPSSSATALNNNGWALFDAAIKWAVAAPGAPTPTPTPTPRPTPTPTGVMTFAAIGDFGVNDANELNVANMVKSWNPAFVITLGDNNYSDGAASTIDQNIGKYYHDFISPYTGSYGAGATANRFWPSLGNHDWNLGNCNGHLNYFALPNNERYYDFVRGPVHFFALDSDGHEPDGTSSTSIQGRWLQSKLAASKARWKIVYFHHPPYSSSSTHGSSTWMRWPFQQWGASAVLSGHDHTYERLDKGGFPYFVNGLGGRSRYAFGSPLPESVVRYNSAHGAQHIEATNTYITFTFYNTSGLQVDSFTLRQ
ncbi:MAG: metallophosphoesterase [Pyrinomonadaceae bacterium]